jgi:hypothetical protein
MTFVCTSFDDFERHYGTEVGTEVLQRICEAGYAGGTSGAGLYVSVERHNALNMTMEGTLEHDGLDFYFKIDDGDGNGTEVREFVSDNFPQMCQALLSGAPAQAMEALLGAVREDLLQHQFSCLPRDADCQANGSGAVLQLDCALEDGLAGAADDALFIRLELRLTLGAALRARCALQLYRQVGPAPEAVPQVRWVHGSPVEWPQAQAGLVDFLADIQRGQDAVASQVRTQLLEVMAP